jgi:tetratricopeptide (TPR) repeat protein
VQARQWKPAISDLAKALEMQPSNPWARRLLTAVYMETGQSERALALAMRAADATVEWAPVIWLNRADVQLARGDSAGYRRTCAEVLRIFGKTQDPIEAHGAALVCAIGPNAAADPAMPVQLARRAVARQRNSDTLHALGAVLYRAGEYVPAVARMTEAMAMRPGGGTAPDCVFMAMAHQRLGHAAEARRWLDRSVARERAGAVLRGWGDRLETRPSRPSISGQGSRTLPVLPGWGDLLEMRLLLAEAKALVKPPRDGR